MSTTFVCKDLKFEDINNFSIADIIICKKGKLEFNFDRAVVSFKKDLIKINYLDKEIVIGLEEDSPCQLEYRVGSVCIKYFNYILETIDINTK